MWVLWWQGIDKAPDIVKICIQSIRKNIGNRNLVILDESNFRDYTNLNPKYENLLNAGAISKTQFSDLLRLNLLYNRGGVWLDSTYLLTGELPNCISDLHFFTIRHAYLFAEKRFDEIHKKIAISFNYIFFMGFGCCFGIMGVAKTFVPFFFGPGYDQVVGLLYLFSPIIVIIGISNCLGSQYYTPCGKRKESTNYLIAGSVVNLILNLLMIPRFGAEGAAIASVIAETVVSVLYVKFSCGYTIKKETLGSM